MRVWNTCYLPESDERHARNEGAPQECARCMCLTRNVKYMAAAQQKEPGFMSAARGESRKTACDCLIVKSHYGEGNLEWAPGGPSDINLRIGPARRPSFLRAQATGACGNPSPGVCVDIGIVGGLGFGERQTDRR